MFTNALVQIANLPSIISTSGIECNKICGSERAGDRPAINWASATAQAKEKHLNWHFWFFVIEVYFFHSNLFTLYSMSPTTLFRVKITNSEFLLFFARFGNFFCHSDFDFFSEPKNFREAKIDFSKFWFFVQKKIR